MTDLARRYYCYRATLSYGFYLPISVLYMQSKGLSLADIGLVEGLFLFGMVVAELPTGYLGDRLGRRGALALGNSISAAVMIGFVFASSVASFAAVYSLWAVGWTLRSGTADAWLYELLAEHNSAETFTQISGRANAVSLGISAAAALSAGFLYTVTPWLPFVANAVLSALGLPVLLSLPRTRVKNKEQDPMGVRRALNILAEQARRPVVRWLVVYAALFNIVFSVTRVFEQPALRAVGIPVTGLGLLYAGFKIVSAGAAGIAGPLRKYLGTRGVLFSLVPIFGVFYGTFAFFPLALVPAVFVRRAMEQVVHPVRNEYINNRIGDIGRATVLSGVSMVLSLASGMANTLGSRVAGAIGPITFLSVTGVIVSIAGGVLWLFTSPVRG